MWWRTKPRPNTQRDHPELREVWSRIERNLGEASRLLAAAPSPHDESARLRREEARRQLHDLAGRRPEAFTILAAHQVAHDLQILLPQLGDHVHVRTLMLRERAPRTGSRVRRREPGTQTMFTGVTSS